MCEFASFVVTKKSVLWGYDDHHEVIIEENKLHADGANGVNIVRVEIVPPCGDVTKPLDEWVYRVDQDMLPDWHDAEETERRARKALVDLVAARVFTSGDHKIGDGFFVASGSATVEASGSATVEAYDSATVRAYGSATVRAYDSATVEAFVSATVRAYDSATVRAYGSATVRAYDSATVRAFVSATVEASGSATVRASGSATVRACKNNATVRHYNAQECKPEGPFAVMIDCTGGKAVCITGVT